MEILLHNFAYALDYLREQIADVTNDNMVAQPHGFVNHPAWVLGHLTFSCQALGGEIGLDRWLPDSWGKRFGMGSVPMPDVAAYEAKSRALEILADAQSRITAAVKALSPSQLDQPLPDKNYANDLPTIRHAISQILVSHPAYHVGQVAVWRRMMGMPAIGRPFL